jgi:hypothetical protein
MLDGSKNFFAVMTKGTLVGGFRARRPLSTSDRFDLAVTSFVSGFAASRS